MRNLLFALIAFCITSCGTVYQLKHVKPDQSWIMSWGDDRFHPCNELLDEYYHVYGTDTVLVKSVYRTTKYCTNGKQK